ncbi:glutamate racemase [Amedibacillus sp. YH-ame6]
MGNLEKAIGVFDSGLGGISVLNELRKMMPSENFIYFGDSKFAPYGVKSKEEITARCESICEFFMMKGVKAIVIACNTATSACVNELRDKYPMIPIIGMEPALKVAAEKEGKQNIVVLATQFTLKEKKFAQLMSRYEEENTIYKQPCPKLVEIVEGHQLTNQEVVETTLKEYLDTYDLSTIHSIVLGCTHFVFFKEVMKKLLPTHIEIIDGNHGTAKHLVHILEEQEELKKTKEMGEIKIYNSMKHDEAIMELSKQLLHI